MIKNSALSAQIEMLGRTDPHVHNALDMVRYQQATYEEAMQMLVLNLSAVVETQQKTILEFAMRQTTPYLVRT